ncbi:MULTISPECIES: DUF805 domain-containing protein [unclassified Acinetobacter]|uniref:DUF805 domain-containing protein n=1 Tax=unclassified Acinetobacter TaxID=196816 RepID=UPI00190A39D3|nr:MULTISPECIES: DUF805 domain-containing protein [unclassified Acinetobacter]MBK0063426.1 DUF805 domain-containing protein [Acinetobacter sp. S55]MBK0065503.1 DUF805 domain-containing protein [Acinetobacter sp. S54]
MRSSVQGTQLANDSPLSAQGRFGRLSYAAWTLISSIFFIVACVAIGFGIHQMSQREIALSLQFSLFIFFVIGSLYAGFLYFNFIFMIRRLHDRNQSGWLSLFYIVPPLNLFFIVYLLCAKGNERLNDFGPARYTCTWERVFGWIYIALIPVSIIIGILIAVMIPTYQDYLQ